VRRKGGNGRKGGELSQTLYEHMNKRNFLKKNIKEEKRLVD
jgi:hypothetical protein